MTDHISDRMKGALVKEIAERAVSTDQYGYRIRIDGTAFEGGIPVWAAPENTPALVRANTPFRVRMGIGNYGSTATPNTNWSIRYSVNGGGYNNVAAGINAGKGVGAVDATNGVSPDDSTGTTMLLTPPTGLGLAQNNNYDFDGEIKSLGTMGAGRWCEFEWGLALNGTVIDPTDVVTFRVYVGANPVTTSSQTPTVGIGVVQKASSAALMIGA